MKTNSRKVHIIAIASKPKDPAWLGINMKMVSLQSKINAQAMFSKDGVLYLSYTDKNILDESY